MRSKSAAWLAAGALLASSGLLAACDKSAQNGDGTTAENAVGTAAYTPNGQVTPIGADTDKLDSPEVTAQAPANSATGAGAPATTTAPEGGMAAQTSAGATGSAAP
ncbi:hypothetical protein DJ018_00635 [Phenylobacterium deserti]|uniref:Lipoprotein n=2 Tax=Phenylobacterium deserti TaxID=1914756 RepID=A0A328ASN1_9CAUL|nr:hypothetical protein DJ018_00635 [Phenylobacterium deserti]